MNPNHSAKHKETQLSRITKKLNLRWQRQMAHADANFVASHTDLFHLFILRRVFGMFNEVPVICACWWRHFLRNAAEIPSKPNSNSQNGHATDSHSQPCDTHLGTRHTEKRKTYQETVTSRHNAEHAMIPNATKQWFCETLVDFTLKNTSENHIAARKRCRHKLGSHASTVKRLSKSPTANHTTQDEARLATIAFAEKLPAVPRDHNTHHKKTCSRAQPNFSCHEMLRTSLSSDTRTPLVRNTADNACPMPTAPPRQRGNTSSAANEFASDGESKMESQSLVANCVERPWDRKGHAPPRTRPSKLSGNGQSRRVCERPHLGKRQLIANIAHPTFTTGSESFSSRRTTLLNPMSVSSGLKTTSKMDGAGYMSFIIAKLSVHTMFRSGFCSNEILLVCGKRCVPSATRPAQRVQLNASSSTRPARRTLVHKRSGACGPVNQLKRPKPQTT